MLNNAVKTLGLGQLTYNITNIFVNNPSVQDQNLAQQATQYTGMTKQNLSFTTASGTQIATILHNQLRLQILPLQVTNHGWSNRRNRSRSLMVNTVRSQPHIPPADDYLTADLEYFINGEVHYLSGDANNTW